MSKWMKNCIVGTYYYKHQFSMSGCVPRICVNSAFLQVLCSVNLFSQHYSMRVTVGIYDQALVALCLKVVEDNGFLSFTALIRHGLQCNTWSQCRSCLGWLRNLWKWLYIGSPYTQGKQLCNHVTVYYIILLSHVPVVCCNFAQP